MKRSSVVAGIVLLGLLLATGIYRAGGITALPTETIRMVDSAGTVLDGIASATVAAYQKTVRVVDSTGHVIDSFIALVTTVGASTLDFTNGILRYFSINNAQHVMAQQFGAKCDNATDDTAAFAAALTAAGGGGVVDTPPGKTCRITSITVGSTSTTDVTLRLNNTNLRCITNDATADCVKIGNFGHVMGLGRGSGSAGTAIIGSLSTTVARSLVTNATQTGTQANFDLQNVQIAPNQASTISQGALWINSVDGFGYVANVGITGYQGTLLRMESGAAPATFLNGFTFINVSVACSGLASCIPMKVVSGGGQVSNITFLGGSIVDTGSAGPLLSLDGQIASMSGSMNSLTFQGTYFESFAGETGNFVNIRDASDVRLEGVYFNGGPALTDCVNISQSAASGTNGIFVHARTGTAICTNTINNTIDSYTSGTVPDMWYYYSKQNSPQTVMDVSTLAVRGAITGSANSVANIMSPPTGTPAVCDGSTDDTAAIQAVLDAVPTGGGGVFKPPGKICKVTSQLTVSKANTTFYSLDSFSFVTADIPAGYLDCQVTNANCIKVNAQGYYQTGLNIKYPSTTGAALGTPPAPALAATSGTLPAATYYVKVSCLNANGQTLLSSESSQAVGANGGITVTAPTCGSGATGWNTWASANTGNETKNNATANTLGVDYTITALANNAYPTLVDSTGFCAIFDSNAGVYYHNKLWTPDQSSAPFGLANGYCGAGSSFQLIDNHISGFYNGVLRFNRTANNFVIDRNFFQSNEYGIVTDGGGAARITNNDFENEHIRDIWSLSGALAINQNYFEQQLLGGVVNSLLQLGDNTNGALVNGQLGVPTNIDFENNFVQCNSMTTTGPIIIQEVSGLKYLNNNHSNCGSQTIITNTYANAAAAIKVLDNKGTVSAWTSSTMGFTDYDTTGTRIAAGLAASGANSDITSLSGLTTPISVPQGGSGLATLTAHGFMLGEGTSAVSLLAPCAAGAIPYGQGAADPVCSTLTYPNAATLGDLIYASGTNALGRLADVGTGQVLTSGGVGAAPAYSATPNLTTLSLTSNLTVSSVTDGVSVLGTNGGTSHLSINRTTTTAGIEVVDNGNSGIPLYTTEFSSSITNVSALRQAKGTIGAPRRTTSGFGMGNLEFIGCYAADDSSNCTFPAAGPGITSLTTQAWTATANGSKLQFYTIPNSSTTRTLSLTLDQDQSATFASSVQATSYKIGATTQKFPQTFTVTYDPASLAAQVASASQRCDTVTVTGITTTGGAVTANAGVNPAAGCVVSMVRASAADTVIICWENVDTFAACDTASSAWTFTQAQ